MRRTPVPHRFDVALALRRRPRHRRALVVGAGGAVRAGRDDGGAAGRGGRRRVGRRGPGAGGDARPRRRRPRSTPATPASTTSPSPLVPDGALSRAARRSAGSPSPSTRARWCARSGSRPAASRRWRRACPPGTRAMAIPVEPGHGAAARARRPGRRAGGARRRRRPATARPASPSPPTCSWSTSTTRR